MQFLIHYFINILQLENKQQEKEFAHKRREKDSVNLLEVKKKRVSFAADLEKLKVFDKRMKLTVSEIA